MKKFALMIATAVTVLAPVAGAYGTTVGHDVRQYVQNRDRQLNRNVCASRHGKFVKYNGRWHCVVPKHRRW